MEGYRKKCHYLLLGIAFFLQFGHNAFAEDSAPTARDSIKGDSEVLKEVTIEAERENLHLLEIPSSATYIGEQILNSEASRNMGDISKYVSNFYIQGNGSKLSAPIYMRGVGTISGTPSVGLYVDGVPVFDKNSYIFDLYDITRIEVLKGPQSTLYGRNSINGLINIKTVSPINRLIINADASAGSYDTYRGMAAITIPSKEDQFANKFAFNWSKNGGFYRNAYNGKKCGDSQNLSLRYKAFYRGDEHSAMLGVEYTRTNDGGYAYHVLDSLKKKHYTVNYNSPSKYNRDIVRTHINASFNKFGLKISNVLAYTFNQDRLKVDADYTMYDVFENKKISKGNLVSEEFNIGSGKKSKISWNAGVFAFYKNQINKYTAHFGKDSHLMLPLQFELAKYYNTTRSGGIAAYGHIKFPDLWNGGTVSTGLRYDYEKVTLDYSDDIKLKTGWIYDWQKNNEKSDFNAVTPKLSILQKFENTSLYLTVSKGYKSGGYNVISNEMSSQITDLSFDSESLWNYEAGCHYISRDNRISADLSAFFINWHDQQTFIIGMMGPSIKNSGDSHNFGFDGNLSINLLDKHAASSRHTLDYHMAAGYVNAKYHKNENPSNIGNRIVMSPDFTLYTGIDYSAEIRSPQRDRISISTWVNGIGRQYFDEENTLKQNPYFLWNSEITYQRDKWIVSLWGKNMLDKHYFCYEFKSPIGNKKSEYLNSGQSGSPAIYGITLKFRLINN